MAEAMGTVLVEKETIGNTVTPKSTIKNAALTGLADVAQREGERRALELEGRKEYVTVSAGRDLIVSVVGER